MIDPKQPEGVQAAAVRALGRVRGAEIGTFLIERWRAMTRPCAPKRPMPCSRIRSAPSCFWRRQDETVQPWTLQFRHKRNLLMSRDVAFREEARALLEEKAGEREQVLSATKLLCK